jgi:hypothetical protein
MGKHIRFRLFLVVIFVFIGAVIFISEPFVNKTETTPDNGVVSVITDSSTVSIDQEEVAKGIPAVSNFDSKWALAAIAVTVVNMAGAIGIVIMTSRDVVQV